MPVPGLPCTVWLQVWESDQEKTGSYVLFLLPLRRCWMRADRRDGPEICHRIECDHTKAWRCWQKALQVVVAHLNDRDSGKLKSNSVF